MSTKAIRNMAVEIDGEGETILFIHGLGGSSNTWTPLQAALSGFMRIRPDLPGSARSSTPSTPASIATHVSAMVDLLGSLGVKSAHVVAHSLGSIVAQHLAVEHPELVKSLALFGPLVAPPEAGRAGTLARAALARTGVAAMQEIADTIVNAATSKETKAERPTAVALVRESVMRQPPEGYAINCEILAGAQSAAIEQISVPTLLLSGDQDNVAPVANVAAMATRIKGSNQVVLEACGHWPTFEQPQLCVTQLRHFYELGV